MDKDPPIVEQGFLYGVNVVDIGDIRVARGLSRRPNSTCKHHPLVYDERERRIWCRDCETTVEPFDAFLLLVEQFNAAARHYEKLTQEAESARQHVIRRIAAKKMDEAWSRRRSVPTCPHCRAALMPEDVEKMGRISRDLEIARRARTARDVEQIAENANCSEGEK